MVGGTEVVGGNDELVGAEVEPLELDVHAAVAPSNPAPINTNNPLSNVDFEIVIACSFLGYFYSRAECLFLLLAQFAKGMPLAISCNDSNVSRGCLTGDRYSTFHRHMARQTD